MLCGVGSYPMFQVLAIRTSSLEEKATACNMIVCYIDELREGFFPYVKEVTDLMVPLLKFYFHEEVRRAAVSALPHLVRAAQSAAEKDMPGAPGTSPASKVSNISLDQTSQIQICSPHPYLTFCALRARCVRCC